MIQKIFISINVASFVLNKSIEVLSNGNRQDFLYCRDIQVFFPFYQFSRVTFKVKDRFLDSTL